MRQFIAAGDPPLYLGFGNMIRQDGEPLHKLARQVARRLGCRIVLQRGWQGVKAAEKTPAVMIVDSVPHSWLFPRMAAVVHHGGAGTTAAGLRAGVPSLLVPHFADQFFWAKWVTQCKAGPAPISREKLTADRLVEALKQATTDQRM